MLFTCILKLGGQRTEGFSSSLTLNKLVIISSPKKVIQFSSVTQSCLILCSLMDYSTPAFLSITNSWSLLKLMSIELLMPSNHLILCRPLLLWPSIFPSIRVFSNVSVLPIRRPKYWSFGFSISPSNEYSGLISFRMDWLDLLAPTDLGSSSFSVLSFCLLSCSWGSQGKNTEVVCHFLLQWTTFCQNSIP